MTHAPFHGMSQKQRRLIAIAAIAALLAGALALVLGALRENIVFFYTPSEIPADVDGRAIRLGGLVKTGSVKIDGLNSRFVVTDGEAEIAVSFDGALPSLFREGQGVVAEGRINGGSLAASNVLAKHDETYMPREVADSLREKGVWQGREN
ncbi:MAG: cytochrome c maturation protein CcmE [Pseudomonadota bacterium]|nr:cytochrome c maturation protein CcmE [Pseudomonadota bacterium]